MWRNCAVAILIKSFFVSDSGDRYNISNVKTTTAIWVHDSDHASNLMHHSAHLMLLQYHFLTT